MEETEKGCILCGEIWTIAARGLCTRCYPKERIKGTLNLYVPKRDGWRDIAREVIDLYQGNMTSAEVAEHFGISDTTVRNILKRCKIKIRRTGCARIYNLYEEAFDDLDNELAAYWLGFIYADGHARKGGLIVQLHEKDTDQLIKLREFLKSDTQIAHKINYGFGASVSAVYIAFHSAYLSRRLQQLGIVTGRPCFHRVIENLPVDVYKHFIRGYLDGDGYVSKPPSKPRIKFVGQKELLEWIGSVIGDAVGISERTLYPLKSIWTIVYNGRYAAPSVAHWLYDEATIFMPRKYHNAQAWDYENRFASSAR